jgi:stage II sporulation protein D
MSLSRVLSSFILAASIFLAFGTPAVKASAGPQTIAIRLSLKTNDTTLSASMESGIYHTKGQLIQKVLPLDPWRLRVEDGAIVLENGAKNKLRFEGNILLKSEIASPAPLFFINGNWYRGSLLIGLDEHQQLKVINQVELDYYLASVVGAEMSASWPIEALKAQAVAARSYALNHLGFHKREGYDLKDSTESQVYLGLGSETETTLLACQQTRQLVLTYGHKIIPAYYHAASGGYTENSEFVWGTPKPYLKAVPDYDQKSPHFEWYKKVPQAVFVSKLATLLKQPVGQIRKIETTKRSFSGRVLALNIETDTAHKTVTGQSFRELFQLSSTLFNLGFDGQNWVFAGRGWGHGLGMSQWGAKELAEKGYPYNTILGHYYPSAQLESIGG